MCMSVRVGVGYGAGACFVFCHVRCLIIVFCGSCLTL